MVGSGRRPRLALAPLFALLLTAAAAAQPTGSISGRVLDQVLDNAPMTGAQVLIVETGQKTTSGEGGNFSLSQVPPGKYTVVFSKEGYTSQPRTGVVVVEGRVTELEASLAAEIEIMDPFVVTDVKIGGATQAGLLELRVAVPTLMDSVGSDLISRAGLSNAADALGLVSGATVEGGKFAVVRGLPDRYVNSQMNGVRLPTADADKRAVELDQFPSDVIESIQVSKTFTPDQQGDASGGAVNVVLKGIPEQAVLKLSLGTKYRPNETRDSEFMTYRDKHMTCLGMQRLETPADGEFGISPGASRGTAPWEYDWSMAAGGKHVFDTGIKVGGFTNFYYKRDASYTDDGLDNTYSYQVGTGMVPKTTGADPENFTTQLYDLTTGKEEVQWGWLGTAGIETKNHAINVLYMYTRNSEETAIVAEDTRGKDYYFPGYDRNDLSHIGNNIDPATFVDNREIASYNRLHTLEYVERETSTLQFRGDHTLPWVECGPEGWFRLLAPKLDWTVAMSSAGMYQPDKRTFAAEWKPDLWFSGFLLEEQGYTYLKPSENFTIGYFNRLWKEITETSDQYQVNLKFPFKQWSDEEGYLKVGIFKDTTHREYDQESFSNFGDNRSKLGPDWDEYWTDTWLPAGAGVTDGPPFLDVDYRGDQEIFAKYWMIDFPFTTWFKIVGGIRFENTKLSIENSWERDAVYLDDAGFQIQMSDVVNVDFQQEDILPAIGFQFKPVKNVTVRGSYTETVARQTFKELTPIRQQEYLGGPIFSGNPDLTMAALKNYDLRLDYRPFAGSLYSISWFHKDITNPIEYVIRSASDGFQYTMPDNYPEGRITGIELEARQRMGEVAEALEGLTLGANATFIDSEVTLSDEDSSKLAANGFHIKTREMTNAPRYLYNLYATYELPKYGTQFGLFYTVRGDTLTSGTSMGRAFNPDIYDLEYGTLNFSVSQRLNEVWKVTFKARNLLDPKIQKVYRSDKYLKGGDVVHTSYTKGIDFSFAISAEF